MPSKVCAICHLKKNILQFNKNKSKKDNLQTHCKDCNKARSRKYYSLNKAKHKLKIAIRKKKAIIHVQQYVYDYLKAHGCIECGEKDPCCLDFDHVRGRKRAALSSMIKNACSLKSVCQEIEKCEVRCANCHRKKTSKDQNWYKNIKK